MVSAGSGVRGTHHIAQLVDRVCFAVAATEGAEVSQSIPRRPTEGVVADPSGVTGESNHDTAVIQPVELKEAGAAEGAQVAHPNTRGPKEPAHAPIARPPCPCDLARRVDELS